MYTVAEAKDDLKGMLHGTNLNDITGIDDLLERAGRKVLAELDPAETRRISNLADAIHNNIYQYVVPTDLKGNKIIDIRPQANRNPSDSMRQFVGKEFGKYKDLIGEMMSVRHDDGTKFLKMSRKEGPYPALLNGFNSLTDNGTVAVVATAANLAVNTKFSLEGGKSVEFDIVASGDGIQVTGMTAVDLSTHDEESDHFVSFYAEDVSNITSVTPVWGNDLTANYWTGVAQTTQSNGDAFRNGWNTVKVPWSTATETGTVDPAAIDSLKLTFVTTGAVSKVRVDQWQSSVGEIMEIEYYSRFMFRSSAGVWSEDISDDSDIVNLETDAYNIFLYEAAIMGAQQVMGADGASDINFFKGELHGTGNQLGLYKRYKSANPSERVNAQSTYYRI